MSGVQIVGSLDVAELVFYIFFLFFLGLVIYLRREDRREGYPLEEDIGGALLPNDGLLQRAGPKSFFLPFGGGTISPERDRIREAVDVPGTTRAVGAGSPIEPTGNPLSAGVGPGAYANRADRPDIDMYGNPRIVPLARAGDYRVAPRDPSLIDWPVYGADNIEAGRVGDLWIDTADHLLRYLAVSTSAGARLVPFKMCKLHRGRDYIVCDAINAADFAGAPVPAAPDQVTLLEEEKIQAYFGAGYLYANAARQEPLL